MPEAVYSRDFRLRWDLIRNEIDRDEFSMADYGSDRGFFSLEAAKQYPKSSVVSIEQDERLNNLHSSSIQLLGLTNNIAIHSSLSLAMIDRLQCTADFLDYQLCLNVVHHLPLRTREHFELHLGALLSLAKVTFIEIPHHDQGPRTYNHKYLKAWYAGRKEEEVIEAVGRRCNFDVEVKPIGVSKRFAHERKLLKVVTNRVTRRVVSPRIHVGWWRPTDQLLMHTLVNENDNVHLIRHRDGHIIDYTVSGISLIGLLIMGIGNGTKAHLANLFRRLPYYEDMAPWNVIWTHGSLTIIDEGNTQQLKALSESPIAQLNYNATIKALS